MPPTPSPVDPAEPLDTLTGKHLGNYRINRLLRDTASGRVYLARHTRTGLDVEIKVMPPAPLRDPHTQKRIEREVATLMKLNHQNIIRIWAIGREDDISYLVMEHVEGRTLEQWLDELGRLRTDDALNLTATVLSAVVAAHAMEIVHRDICPTNIVLGDDGRVVIADFGLARFLGQEASGTASFHAREMASNSYKAPEQLENRADFRSDVYAVGTVLYHCICGTLPFDGSKMQRVIARLKQPATPLTTRMPEIPADVNAVVMRFLERDPDKRWPDARSALVAVEQLLG